MRLASDTRLVSLVREGRDGAFEAVYDRHSRGILSFCRHMLGDADEAEDAVQHTFMAAYSDLLTSEKPIHLRAWLFTIARNRCYTILRARREQPSAEIEEAATEGLASQVQRRQDLRDLVSDMRQLPEEQRAALVLAELDSLSHSDIAEVLGVPREKVKALVFQARESLLASRTARDTACAEIREQLACGRGATLRRANLRRHLRDCDGCRAFRAQVERQRRQFAVLLPVVPGIALKEAVLGGTGATAVGAGAISGGAIATGALKGGALKGIVGAVLASVGTAGTLVVAAGNVHMTSLLHDISHSLGTSTVTHRPAAQRSATASTGAAGAGSVALALQRSGLASSSSHVTGGAKAASGSSLGSAVLPALAPTRHVRVAHEQRLQAPFVKHHRGVKWAHAPTAPTSSTPSTSTSSTPVSSAPVSSAPVSSAPVTTASTVASTPVTKAPTTTSTPASPTGVVRTPAPTTVVTPPHVSVAPVTASPRTTTGVTRATTVVTAVGTGSGSRYGSGSGGSTGEGSGTTSGTTSAATTATTSTSATSTSTGTSTTGGTRGSGGTTTTTSTGTSTGTTTTPVIGGSSDSSTTTSTTPAGSGTSTTSTTPGRTLEGSPS